ncbi:MAG: hypothetical protein SLAVMIC_00178 [uncultured marine phage]|uniref:UVR domain-containing protein n=1 Tax=uncultured marine phage TaxID=707152 RepID=A0A8D9FQ06_9VIRU|nr:MAG: hypothetical protein SLAVMIC_00178 [uncultured marine phage]
MGINYYIEDIYNKVRWGDLSFQSRVGNSYYFCNEKQEVCYNVLLESISVAEFNKTGKEWVLYLERNNLEKGYADYSEYLFNSFMELILEIVMTTDELERLDEDLNGYVLSEDYEKASRLRDIINNIKTILNKK